jgi:hypothetical protein
MLTTFRRSVSALVLSSAFAMTASAQPATVQAQSLFDEGRKLLDANKIPEACAAFDASQKLDPAVTTLLNLADCRERNHQLATAWGLFADAERMARARNDDKLAKVGSNHAAKLEPRLSHLTITVATEHAITGLEITRGSDTVPAASWNHALPIDGGTYTITAKAPGHEPWLTTIAIKEEGEARTLEIPALTESKVTVAPTKPGEPGTPIAPVPVDTPPRTHSVVVPLIVGGGAVVLGAVAVGFELSGGNAYDRAKSATNQSQRDSLETTANHRRYIAEGLGVAALGAAGVAVYLLLFDRHTDAPTSGTAIAPAVSANAAGLTVVGHW